MNIKEFDAIGKGFGELYDGYTVLPTIISYLTTGDVGNGKITREHIDEMVRQLKARGLIIETDDKSDECNNDNDTIIRVSVYKIPFDVIYCSSKDIDDFDMTWIGYINMNEFDAGKAWHLCNWMNWTDKKPDNVFASVGSCNREVVFFNPNDNKYYIPKICGWEMRDTEEEVKQFYISLHQAYKEERVQQVKKEWTELRHKEK